MNFEEQERKGRAWKRIRKSKGGRNKRGRKSVIAGRDEGGGERGDMKGREK